MKRRGRRAPWLLLWCAALLCPALRGQNAGHWNGEQFRQTVWSVEHGAPADIWALAQDRDGFLWLGTGSGLYRFDGVAFERFEPRQGENLRTSDITALSMQPDGTLWIGLFHGGASALRDGRLTSYSARDGFPTSMVTSFARTADGALWAASRGGLARFDGTRWEIAGADWHYPAARAEWVMADRDGTLWVTTGEELLSLRRGGHRFEATGIRVARDTTLSQAPDGRIWLSSGPRGTSVLPAAPAAQPSEGLREDPALVHSKRLLFDRRGDLWGTEAMRGGVYRIDAPARLADGRALRASAFDALYDRGGGLPSNVAVPLLEDREGTVWAGTNLGLASYHANNVRVPPGSKVGPGINTALAADARGTLWLANGGVLQRLDADGAQVVADGLPDINAMLAADGTLWLMGGSWLGRLEHGRVEHIEVPVSEPRWSLEALAGDGHGGLWASFMDHGVFHLRDGRWTALEGSIGRGRTAPTALLADAAGRLWAGYPDGRVLCIDGGHQRTYAGAEGPRVGAIATFATRGDELLVGGDRGVARWRDGRFEPLAADPAMLAGVSGIALTAQGEAWINGSHGVLRVSARDLARGFGGQAAAYELFDYHDGLPGIALQATPVSTAAIDARGRVWFNTNQGAAWIDPAQVRRNPAAPATFVQALIAGDRRYAAAGEPRLPQRTSSVRVQYTATSLAMPDRVRFRYRLDGVDDDWQEAGTRREASYANLGPGHYRFRVIAANEDGVWNEQGASLAFSIEPQFFQTGWFRALCLAAGALLAAGLCLWRLRLMAARIHLRLEERMRERERIARELHDTLLQGVQGLLLRLQALAAGLGEGGRTREALDAAIRRARDVLVEGRDRIVALRGESEEGERLAHTLRAVGEEYRDDGSIAFQVSTEGAERALCPAAADEVIDIAREAIRNAFRHAHAGCIDVRVAYLPQGLRIRVRDDGVGIPLDILRHGGRPGHWGLVGMRERAGRLGATLAIRRGKARGTDVVLHVPGQVVFEAGAHGRRA